MTTKLIGTVGDRAFVLMRPLYDLGFPGYFLSVCGHVFSERDQDWMTPIAPKKHALLKHGQGTVKLRLIPPQYRKYKDIKTIRLMETMEDRSKVRREVGIASLMAQIVFGTRGRLPFAGYKIRYHDGDKDNTALWNLWYGAGEGKRKPSVMWDGEKEFKKLWHDPAHRKLRNFEWRAVQTLWFVPESRED